MNCPSFKDRAIYGTYVGGVSIGSIQNDIINCTFKQNNGWVRISPRYNYT